MLCKTMCNTHALPIQREQWVPIQVTSKCTGQPPSINLSKRERSKRLSLPSIESTVAGSCCGSPTKTLRKETHQGVSELRPQTVLISLRSRNAYQCSQAMASAWSVAGSEAWQASSTSTVRNCSPDLDTIVLPDDDSVVKTISASFMSSTSSLSF